MSKARQSDSKSLKRASPRGGKKRDLAKRVIKKRDATTPRQFGSLRGEVTVDEKFFEPLPSEELEGWGR